MIGSFASESGRPAIFLPEQVEVLAHGLFSRSLQILALSRLLERGFFTLRIVAEVWVERKSIGGYFWSPRCSQSINMASAGRFDINPAARAKPPRLERERAHTPVFEQNEIKAFLEPIKLDSLIDKRDKALCNVLLYSWARVSAVVALRVEDYYERKGERWLRLHEKRGKIHEVPVHSKAREAIDQWLLASGFGSNPSAPLFPAFGKNKKTPELRHMDRTSVWKLVQARAQASGLKKRVCCHSFRPTGITEYMNAGGALDIAQRIAGHSELSTTKIYDRSQDRVTIAEIERVSFEQSSEPA